jgi:tripartite motif-containing protein 2/3
MLSSTLKTIFVDGDLDDSSLLLDVQHPYRDKDLLLTNQFDDVEDDVHDQNSPFFGLFPPTTDAPSNTLLSTCLSHDSSGSSSNGSSAAFSFTDSAYASSSSPPPPQHTNNTTSQSISIMRSLQSQQHQPPPPHHQQQQTKHILNQPSTHTSLLTGLPTSSPSSSLSSVHSATTDNPCCSSSPFFHKQQQHQEYHYNYWDCPICQEAYKQTRPQVLQCFHTLCETCVEKLLENDDASICCPLCGLTTMLTDILPDYTVQNNHSNVSNDYMLPLGDNSNQCCTACKSAESMAVAKCFQCSSFLCHQCVCAHQIMNCFEGHRVVHIKELDSNGNDLRSVFCSNHKNETLKYFCATCNMPICTTCTTTDHGPAGHEFAPLNDAGSHQVAKLQNMVENTRQRLNDLKHSQKTVDRSFGLLQSQYNKAQHDINETYTFYRQLIDDRKHELIKELDNSFNEKQTMLTNQMQKIDESVERANLPLEFSDRLFKNSSTTEILMFKRQLENKFNSFVHTMPEANGQSSTFELEFVSNFQAIQTGVRNTFGYVRSSPESTSSNNHYKPRPQKLNNDNFSKIIGPPSTNCSSSINSCHHHHHHHQSQGNMLSLSPTKSIQQQTNTNHLLNGIDMLSCSLPQSTIPKYSNLSTSTPTPMNFPLSSNAIDMNPYEFWSNASQLGTQSTSQQQLSSSLTSNNGNENLNGQDSVVDLVDTLDGYSSMSHHLLLPSRSNGSTLKRHKMIYHQKFGEFGVQEGQFTEPSGVAVNAQGDIIVADTNNHRIQIFDSNGRFRFQFGECGKRDGQLLYPNRVAVFRQSGDIVVTERSPTHQIQIYNQYGQFIRKFGANVLQHPRGVCVDNMGHIIVVECKVMRVFIFDTNGNVLNKFTCSKYLEFPNGVCCNDKQEIFISDNRAHCIKVFSYDGQFLRAIGSEGITNYPIGVVQNSQGDVLIADNHNNFNLTIFTQDGQLINALESKVKHAQCFDVALTDDGSVVLASKDYRIYVYRYLMTPSLMGSGGVNGNNTSSSSPSTTPNSSQMISGECTSPSFINGHGESPPITSNGY